MHSRIVRGFVAGVLASAVPIPMGYIAYRWLHFSRALFRDYVSYWILGHTPTTAAEAIVSQAWQLVFMGFLGVGFALLIGWTGEDQCYAFGTSHGRPRSHTPLTP